MLFKHFIIGVIVIKFSFAIDDITDRFSSNHFNISNSSSNQLQQNDKTAAIEIINKEITRYQGYINFIKNAHKSIDLTALSNNTDLTDYNNIVDDLTKFKNTGTDLVNQQQVKLKISRIIESHCPLDAD